MAEGFRTRSWARAVPGTGFGGGSARTGRIDWQKPRLMDTTAIRFGRRLGVWRGGRSTSARPPPPVRSPCQEHDPADAHASAHKSVLESANPRMDSECASGCTGSMARATAPSPGRPTPGVVKQDKSSGGSADTTKTRSGPQRVRMCSGERPTGAAKGRQSDTVALCQPLPPTPLLLLLLLPACTALDMAQQHPQCSGGCLKYIM